MDNELTLTNVTDLIENKLGNMEANFMEIRDLADDAVSLFDEVSNNSLCEDVDNLENAIEKLKETLFHLTFVDSAQVAQS